MLVAALCMLPTCEVHAAGGQFDVDDAAILEPGRCQVETWFSRLPAEAGTVFRIGPACRVGPIEVGLNFDHLRGLDQSRNGLGPQLKWATDPLSCPLSAGVVWGAYFDLTRGGRPLQTLYAPVTWQVGETLRLNANAGVDRGFTGVQTRRLGASGEWDVDSALTLIAERLTLSGDRISRLGARFNLSESVSLDLSAARVTPSTTRIYMIGLNHDFAR